MKVVFITTMLPAGHYSQIICSGLAKQKDVNLIVYTDKNSENLKIKGCGEIRTVWSKSPKYIFEILRELKKDRPDIVHLQQELNMYGGILSALLFPFLVALIRFSGFCTVVTIHASVYKKQINKEFMKLFHQESLFVQPLILKMVFYYLFRTISLFSDAILVHTFLAKDILVSDYGVSAIKTTMIPIAIPRRFNYKVKKEKYFFYFGYMVRRKGLGYALDGFRKFLLKNPHSPFKLVLAGGVILGQEKAFDEIKNDIKNNKLTDKVSIKGFIEEKEQDILYQKAYAVIIPAIVSMGSSGPLFHANSYGKCVIASKEGHFLEDIRDKETGILTNNNKWDEAFAYAANHLEQIAIIEHNVALKARSRSPIKTARLYLDLYRSL